MSWGRNRRLALKTFLNFVLCLVLFIGGAGCVTKNNIRSRAYYPNGKIAVENDNNSWSVNQLGSSVGGGGNLFSFRATAGGVVDVPAMVPAYGYYGNGAPVETYVIPFSAHPAAERRTWNQYFGSGSEGHHNGNYSTGGGYGYHR